MSKSYSAEEKFPLLLLYLEEGPKAFQKDNPILTEKGRHQKIASGASAVMRQWPGHIAHCWMTAVLTGISIVVVSIFMLALSVTKIHNLSIQCRNSQSIHSNKSGTIHLVHSPSVWTRKQVDILEKISKYYLQSPIELILIQSVFDLTVDEHRSSTFPHSIKRSVNVGVEVSNKSESSKIDVLEQQRSNLKIKNSVGIIVIGPKYMMEHSNPKFRFVRNRRKIIAKELERTKTLEDVLEDNPTIRVVNSTYEEIFKNTPLFLTWHNTNEETRLFAIRVLQLWNHGGIAISLSDYEESIVSSKTKTDKVNNDTVTVEIATFNDLPIGMVTVDDKGLHMETKTPCHAFFGEILLELKSAKMNTKPSDIISKTLYRFCLRGAVNDHYCQQLMLKSLRL